LQVNIAPQSRTLVLIFRPSGAPTCTLHIITHCGTLKNGTYTHLYTSPLDAQNISMHAIELKGASKRNSFHVDIFPRRVLKRTINRRTIQNVFKQFVVVYENLYRYYRKIGGQVTLVYGKTETLPLHRLTCRKDNIKSEEIYTAANKRYSVWIERESNSQQVLNPPSTAILK